MKLSRRQFIGKALTIAGSSVLLLGGENWKKEALWYTKLDHQKVRCDLCPNHCIISNGKRGICNVRKNEDGILYTLVYGRLCSLNIDPVEKKPMYHFLPGKKALSIATAGCNVHCKFCQNWTISQAKPEDIPFEFHSPVALVSLAQKYETPIIAFTYSEPVIFYEYMLAVAREAQEAGVKTVMISNGYINEAPLRELCRYITAVKVDFKGYSEDFYRKIVGGRLGPVLKAMKTVHEENRWLEIVNLVIPTLNDSKEEMEGLCRWIFENVGENVPLHFSRFHPQYLMQNLPPTPIKTLQDCYQIARDNGINYIYLGNIPQQETDDTFCPRCHSLLIRRKGFIANLENLEKGKCTGCGLEIPGIWD
ncbi:MAG: AmmeMemoRadiSam system radical SAM enzyme [Candidatus Marinimicrobia bacterium]|nr:AmmeMemoRadiSam system radical SAM enzyme [Candidatus Neomarinimicrobiota bacterium]